MRIFSHLTKKETRRFNFRHVTRAAQGGLCRDAVETHPLPRTLRRRQSLGQRWAFTPQLTPPKVVSVIVSSPATLIFLCGDDRRRARHGSRQALAMQSQSGE